MRQKQYLMNKLISNALMGVSLFLSLAACGSANKQQSAEETPTASQAPTFNADSAYHYCATQCAFGPRTMNSEGHENCGKWIAGKFASYGLDVVEQKADLKGYDGTIYKATNIIAQLHPEAETRIILCAHWDTRPWADNDPNPAYHHTAIEGANDGASGVAVLIEMARVITEAERAHAAADSSAGGIKPLPFGIDFICFDAEDSGFPQWETTLDDSGDTWCLGSQYWAENPHRPGYRANYGILLDMVGGKGAKFSKEGFSLHYAEGIVNKVWRAASRAGYNKFFPATGGGYITDDHVPLNETAHIPTIDIVPYHPECQQSNFGPTWHTMNDNMQNIDRETLKAVGQTVLFVLFG